MAGILTGVVKATGLGRSNVAMLAFVVLSPSF